MKKEYSFYEIGSEVYVVNFIRTKDGNGYWKETDYAQIHKAIVSGFTAIENRHVEYHLKTPITLKDYGDVVSEEWISDNKMDLYEKLEKIWSKNEDFI